MESLLSVTALLIVLIGGFGITLLLMKGNRSVGLIEALALSFLFGTGFVSLSIFLMSFLIAGPALQSFVTIACVAIAAIAWLIRWDANAVQRPSPPDLKRTLLAAVVLVQIGAIIWLALHTTLGWDGLIVWEYKARLAFLNGGHIPLRYFGDVTEQWTHHEYPLYLPLTETWLYMWLGRSDQGWVKLVFPLFYAAAAGLLFVGAYRLSASRWYAAAAAILLFFVPEAIGGVGGSSGYADFPLAVVYLAAMIYLLEYSATGATGPLRLASSLAALLTWGKLEGTILWIIVALLLATEAIRRRQWRALPQVLLPGAILIAGWKMFLIATHCPPKILYMPVTLGNLWSNIGRVKSLALWMATETVSWSRWSVLWPALLISLLLMGKRSWRDGRLSLLIGIVVPTALYLATYIFTNWSPYMQHVESSMSRLMLAPALLALLIIATAMRAPARKPLEETSYVAYAGNAECGTERP